MITYFRIPIHVFRLILLLAAPLLPQQNLSLVFIVIGPLAHKITSTHNEENKKEEPLSLLYQ